MQSVGMARREPEHVLVGATYVYILTLITCSQNVDANFVQCRYIQQVTAFLKSGEVCKQPVAILGEVCIDARTSPTAPFRCAGQRQW